MRIVGEDNEEKSIVFFFLVSCDLEILGFPVAFFKPTFDVPTDLLGEEVDAN